MMIHDFKFAVRSLAKRPAFTAACVLTLALGIGATTAIFSAVNGVVLRPLPYPDDQQLMMLWYNNAQEGIERDVTNYPTFQDWRAAESFRSVAGFLETVATFTGDRPAEQFAGAWVTADFFRTLGVVPAAGMALDATHMRGGEERVIVLSQRARNAWFGADESVVGRSLEVNGVAREVIGVMPQGFSYPIGADYWMPMAMDVPPFSQFAETRNNYWLGVFGRLAEGATVETATAELDAVMGRLAAEELVAPADRVFVEPLRDTIFGSVRPALAALTGAVAFVLLIACANIANLLLARGAARQREFAVRSALGARSATLVRQALVESLVLGVAGGALGLVLAYAGTAAIVAFGPTDLPRLHDIEVDTVVVGFAMIAAVVTGLVFGLAPALQARAAALTPVLRAGDRGATGGAMAKLRPALVVFEVALALVLLVGAGLLLRSFAELQAVDPGFRTENVLSFRVTTPPARYPDPAQARAFQEDFIARVEALPGVESVAAVNTLFLSALPSMSPVTIEGRPPPSEGEPVVAVTNNFVTPDFFQAMEVPLTRGRRFGPGDIVGNDQVVIVNESFVRRLMPGEDPLGRRFTRNDPTSDDAVWQTIIGVVADTRRSGLAETVRPGAYRPTTQVTPGSLEYLVQTAVPPLSVVPQIREQLRELDPNIALAQLRTVEAALADALATRRFVMLLLTGFAALALTLAVIGLYGVLAYLVVQRTREIGLRMALGAGRQTVTTMVLRQSLRYVVTGVVIGAVAAFALTRTLQGQLHGISATDPATFIGVTVTLLLVAMGASWWPARRAAAVDPMEALRED